MAQRTMPQIDTIVFLMMENRSLDNVLGWLYEDDPAKDYNGLRTNTYFQPLQNGARVDLHPVIPVPDDLLDPYKFFTPYYDPTEEMYSQLQWTGVINQLFGNEEIIRGMPGPPNFPAPAMQGFLQDYYRYGRNLFGGQDILWTYPPRYLPILNSLARSYAVSDAWFSSVPTQTNPNRAYSIIGTSQGHENNRLSDWFEAHTIFNSLGVAGKTWGLYFYNKWIGSQSYTEFTFPWMTSRDSGQHFIGSHHDFFTAAAKKKLPNFTYLEPQWGGVTPLGRVQGTDYHPPMDVRYAELFLLQVYLALRNSPHWDNLLFIVSFDEHGGTFDHVGPAWGAQNPDGINGKLFNFDLFGARVPTLLISPFVREQTVFRAPVTGPPFDHTSFIKTFLLWAGIDPDSCEDFGKRMPKAPTFESVLSPVAVNDRVVDLAALPCESGDTLNAMFEGVGFASVKKILRDCRTIEEATAEVVRYHANPAAFEAELLAESGLPEG